MSVYLSSASEIEIRRSRNQVRDQRDTYKTIPGVTNKAVGHNEFRFRPSFHAGSSGIGRIADRSNPR